METFTKNGLKLAGPKVWLLVDPAGNSLVFTDKTEAEKAHKTMQDDVGRGGFWVYLTEAILVAQVGV